ncbi:MAG: glycosyltransferase family protein, partial [Owenweeksia sp.]
SYLKTLFKNNLITIFQEIRSFPVQNYDVVINDFEFITAWACKMRKVPCIGMGHQASFQSLKTPRPKRREWLGEMILRNYAPCSKAIGFHFDHFDTFIQRPVIRGEIRQANITNKGHYTVYLPAFGDEKLHHYLSQVPHKKWEVFSKFTNEPYTLDNVHFKPISNTEFIKSFTSCEGILTSAGFETPAEALYMGKKIFVIPIKRQYEQFCNAEAMRTMGLPMAKTLNELSLSQIKDWVKFQEPLSIDYPDVTRQIIRDEIFSELQKEQPVTVS